MNGRPVADFALVDHHGRSVRAEDLRGRYLLVYFGFTHCKVVCPRSLSKLSHILDMLGAAATEIAPLYITVDPQRDTPAVMKTYLETSYPRFLGLTGSAEAVLEAKSAFRVFAERKADPAEPDGYVVPHSAMAYLMNPDGNYCAHFLDSEDEEVVRDRILGAVNQATVVSAGER